MLDMNQGSKASLLCLVYTSMLDMNRAPYVLHGGC